MVAPDDSDIIRKGDIHTYSLYNLKSQWFGSAKAIGNIFNI